MSQFEVTAKDADGLVAVQTYSLSVRDVNTAPVFVSTPIVEAEVGARYLYQAVATDSEDAVRYALVSGPVGRI